MQRGSSFMNLYHSLSRNCFKKDRLGRTLFCPLGALGKAYVVESTEMENRLKKSVSWFQIFGILVVILTYRLLGIWEMTLAMVILYVPYHIRMNFHTKHLLQSNERLSFREVYVRESARWPFALLVIIEVVLILAVVSLLWSMSVQGHSHDLIVIILIVSVVATFNGWLIYLNRLARKDM